jgi:hypothetical protein
MAEGPEMMSRRKSFGKQTPKPPDGPFGENGSWVHGCAYTPEYRVYISTKSRCVNPKNPQWRYYGARGIEFRFPSFPVFWKYMCPRPAGMILSRIRNDGHFEIGNVHWTTHRESAKNRRIYRKARATTCGHPKHHAKGLCRSCYEATPKVRARRAAYDAAHRIPTSRKIAVRINSCGHLDRPHYAFGLCVACYRISPEGRAVSRRYGASPKGKKARALYAATPESRARQNAYSAARYVPRPPRPRAVNVCGHPDRPHKAKGQCQSCYDAIRSTVPSRAKRTPGGLPADLDLIKSSTK